jgi:hypothetical protein
MQIDLSFIGHVRLLRAVQSAVREHSFADIPISGRISLMQYRQQAQ